MPHQPQTTIHYAAPPAPKIATMRQKQQGATTALIQESHDRIAMTNPPYRRAIQAQYLHYLNDTKPTASPSHYAPDRTPQTLQQYGKRTSYNVQSQKQPATRSSPLQGKKYHLQFLLQLPLPFRHPPLSPRRGSTQILTSGHKNSKKNHKS